MLKMSYDGFVTHAVVHELKNKISGSKIDKIYQPEKDEIIISLRTFSDSFKLLLSASPANPRLGLTLAKKENPIVAPLFCMILRKHLQGGKFINIYQNSFDRTIIFEIESYTELGDLTVKKLIIEIMGRHSNIILVNENNIITDSIKHIDFTVSSVRQILPGLKYEFPPKQDKYTPDEITVEILKEIMLNLENQDIEKALLSSIMGLSPLIANEIVYRFGKLSLEEFCFKTFEVLKNISANNFMPTLIYDSNGKHPIAFSCLKLTQYGSLPDFSSDSISEIIDKFYEERTQNERLTQKASGILKVINNNLERCRKKISLHKSNLLKSQNRDKYKIFGDLLTANIYRINYGDTTLKTINFYSEKQEEIEIPLMSDLSPSANAQRYYKLFSKAKTTEEFSKNELKKAEAEEYYLETVLEALEIAQTPNDIDDIKEELTEQGYISKIKKKSKKTASKARPLEFKSSDGYSIFVGRNNKENDYLTLKDSYSTDIWLHTKIIPGSHTIIKTKGSPDVPDNTILEAACLAAYYSKARNSAQVPVDYTTIKNIKKPNGAKPGFVIYDNYNTVYISPDENIVNKLKANLMEGK